MRVAELAFYIFVFCGSLVSAQTSGEDPVVLVATSSNLNAQLPYDLVNGKKKIQVPSNVHLFKLTYFFDTPVAFQKVEVETCGGTFAGSVDFYFNFDQQYSFAEGGKKVVSARFLRAAQGELMTSLTLVFKRSARLCLGSIRFLRNGKPLNVTTPEIIEAQVTASVTLPPGFENDVMNLFDSRFDTAWVTDLKKGSVKISLVFPEERTISRLRFWNGHQRSSQHFAISSRAREIKVTNEKGQSESFEIPDTMGGHTVQLKKNLQGRQLQLQVSGVVYEGRAFRDVALTEIRMADEKSWFSISPMKRLQQVDESNREKFDKAKMTDLLDRNLITQDEDGDNWVFRFRSDGTIFLRGYTDNWKTARAFYGLGTYEILSAKPKEGLKVQIMGAKKSSPFEMDSDHCAWFCAATKAELKAENIFSDLISIKKGPHNSYILNNRSPRKSQTVPFFSLRAKVTAVEE